MMQNSVLTKLKQAGFSAELIDFLLQFYIGAVNVYGIISLDDLYDLFQKIKEHNAAYPKITSEQFISFGELTGGQSGTHYLVYNPAVFDKYSKQVDNPLTSPLLVNKKVTWTEINIQQIWNLYQEICQECGRRYLTPENLLDYATHEENEAEKNFRQALSELKLDGKKLDKVASRIIPGDTAVNEIIDLVTYIYQSGAGVLYDAENELQFAFEYYKLKLSQHEFKEMSTLMKQAVYEQPCWGLGGRSYVEVKGYDTGDDFDETFYDEDDDDFF